MRALTSAHARTNSPCAGGCVLTCTRMAGWGAYRARERELVGAEARGRRADRRSLSQASLTHILLASTRKTERKLPSPTHPPSPKNEDRPSTLQTQQAQQDDMRRTGGASSRYTLRMARDNRTRASADALTWRVRLGGARAAITKHGRNPAKLLRALFGDLAGGAYELEALFLVLKLRAVRFHSVGFLLRLGL